MTCYCESCSAEPKYTYTVAFMRLCEARSVCAMPTRKARQDYIAGVRAKRGDSAADELAGLVRKEWEVSKGNNISIAGVN